MRVLDCHSHAFPDAVAPSAVRALVHGARTHEVAAFHDGTLSGLLDAMDRAGIERTLLYSVATKPSQVRKITDWSAAIAGDRVIPFASVHPDYEAPEQEVERVRALGLKGLKFHPQYMGCAPDDPRCVRIARAAAAHGLAMTFHAGHDPAFQPTDIASPRRFRALHEAVPDLRFVACHLGGWREWDEVVELLVGQDIYLDTSYSLADCPAPLLERILSRHPSTRLLFGTDSPWADSAVEVRRFRALPLSPDAMRAALWENGHRFAGLEP